MNPTISNPFLKIIYFQFSFICYKAQHSKRSFWQDKAIFFYVGNVNNDFSIGFLLSLHKSSFWQDKAIFFYVGYVNNDFSIETNTK